MVSEVETSPGEAADSGDSAASPELPLPPAEENTAYTLMSYTDVGGPYSSYRPYDVAALMWLIFYWMGRSR